MFPSRLFLKRMNMAHPDHPGLFIEHKFPPSEVGDIKTAVGGVCRPASGVDGVPRVSPEILEYTHGEAVRPALRLPAFRVTDKLEAGIQPEPKASGCCSAGHSQRDELIPSVEIMLEPLNVGSVVNHGNGYQPVVVFEILLDFPRPFAVAHDINIGVAIDGQMVLPHKLGVVIDVLPELLCVEILPAVLAGFLRPLNGFLPLSECATVKSKEVRVKTLHFLPPPFLTFEHIKHCLLLGPDANHVKQLRSCRRILEESPGERRGYQFGVLLRDSSGLHTEVGCFEDAGRSRRLEVLVESVRYLLPDPFLSGEPAAKALHKPGQLGNSDELLPHGDVGNVGPSEEGQHMVFAGGVKLDVLQQNHLIVLVVGLILELLEDFFRVCRVSREQRSP